MKTVVILSCITRDFMVSYLRNTRKARSITMYTKKQKVRQILPAAAMNFLIYGMNAVYYPFVSIFLGRNFDDIPKGQLLSIGPIVICISLLFWGRIADAAKTKNSVLTGVIIAACVSFAALMTCTAFLPTAIALAVLMCFMAPYISFTDTITLEALEKCGVPYGPVRVLGTAGYAVISVIAGQAIDRGLFPYSAVYLVTAALAIAAVMLTPKVAGGSHVSEDESKEETEKKSSSRRLSALLPTLRRPDYLIVVAVNFVGCYAWFYSLDFLPGYLTENFGMSTSFWGLNTAAALALEIPFFILFDKIYSKFSLKTIMLVSVFFSIARYVLLYFTQGGVPLLILSAFTGAWVSIFCYCAIYFLHKIVPDEHRAAGISITIALGQYLPQVLAGQLGGVLTEKLGFQTCTAINAAAFLLCLIPVLLLPKGTFLIRKEEPDTKD